MDVRKGTLIEAWENLLGCGTVESILDALTLTNDSHTTASSTESGLDDDWVSVFLDELLGGLELTDWTIGTWDDWDVVLDGEVTGRDLVSERVDDLWCWTDKLGDY